MLRLNQQALAAFFCLLLGRLGAQPLEYRVTLGGRGAALGESAIALSPSPLSIYYNPAALGFMQQGGFLVDYSNLFGANVHEGLAAAATPIPLPYGSDKQGGFGFMVNFEGIIKDNELHYGRYIVSSALGLPLTRRFALGANFKVVFKNAELENIGNTVSGSGTGLDLALHYQWPWAKQSSLRQIDLALVAYDVYDTRVGALLPESTDLVFQRAIRGGAALHFRDFFSRRAFALRRPALLLQLDDRWHLGGEVTLLNTLALRGGYARDIGDPGESILTFGFGLDLDDRAGNVQFDYAYIHTNSLLPDRHLFTLQAPMFKGPPEVAITNPEVAPIFASFYLSYPASPAAQHNSVQIENLTNTTLNGKFTQFNAPLGISLNEKLATPFSLQPHERRTVQLPLAIASSILKANDLSEPVQAKLHFEFATSSHPNKRQRVEKNFTMVVHGKNYLTWDELARAAAFITPNDRRVQALRERAAQFLADSFWQHYRPIYRAAQFYEALIENGVAYLPDTRLKFDSLYTARGFDKIKYPGELLSTDAGLRHGDCDDLMALYAALLESDNIATALVGTTDHVLLLFDTGIPRARRSLLPLPDSLLLQFSGSDDFGLHDRIWLPVEVTAVGPSRVKALPFPQAIVQGASFIREAQATKDSLFEIVSTAFAWEKFPAALPPDSSSMPPFFLAAGERVKNALSGLNRFRNDHIRQLVSTQALNNEAGLAAGIQHAILCAYLENYDTADSILLALGKRFGERYEVLNNRGNLALLRGEFKSAAQFYHRALQRQPDFVQGYLNRILLHQACAESQFGNVDSLKRFIARDSLTVCRLYDENYRGLRVSLERLQGLAFLVAAGRGQDQTAAKPAKPDTVKVTRALSKPQEQKIINKAKNFFRRLSNYLNPPDPRVRRKYIPGGRGEDQLLATRLIELLYWSTPQAPEQLAKQ